MEDLKSEVLSQTHEREKNAADARCVCLTSGTALRTQAFLQGCVGLEGGALVGGALVGGALFPCSHPFLHSQPGNSLSQ